VIGGYKCDKLFLEFMKYFDLQQVHNMMTIMLDICFESLHVVEKLMGHGNAN
jgi:hypothetical protein